MNLGRLASILSAFSRTLSRTGAGKAAGIMCELVKVLSAQKELSVKVFLKAAAENGAAGTGQNGVTAGAAVPVLEGLLELAEAIEDKELSRDIVQLVRFLRERSEVPVSAFGPKVVSASRKKVKKGTAAVDQALVQEYLKRLETALGKDDEFMKLYHELYADARVTKLEAVEVADRFMGPVAPSTSRSKALQRVLYRHRKLMDFSSASSSIGGKAA